MLPISSNHWSVDTQARDAYNHLRTFHPDHADAVLKEFPELDHVIFEGSWFDTEAMGVGVEWGSWPCDAIENTGVIFWDDGEPYCTHCD